MRFLVCSGSGQQFQPGRGLLLLGDVLKDAAHRHRLLLLDEHTGASSRTFLNQRLGEEIQRMEVSETPAAFFLIALDYARIRVARDDSRSMVKAYVAGMGFVLRRMLTGYGIAVAFLVLQLALVVGYLAYETNAPAAGTWTSTRSTRSAPRAG